jgi:hypothetical protein
MASNGVRHRRDFRCLAKLQAATKDEDMSSKIVKVLVVEGFACGVLDRPIHPLGLAIGLRVVGLGEVMLAAVLGAEAIEPVSAKASSWPSAVLRHVGERDAIVGQDGVRICAGGGAAMRVLTVIQD